MAKGGDSTYSFAPRWRIQTSIYSNPLLAPLLGVGGAKL